MIPLLFTLLYNFYNANQPNNLLSRSFRLHLNKMTLPIFYKPVHINSFYLNYSQVSCKNLLEPVDDDDVGQPKFS